MAANANPKTIQTLMGHSNIKTTMDLYAKLYPGFEGAAAASLDALRNGSRPNGEAR